MSEDVQRIGDLDPLVHQPARLMILTLLAAVESADFLYLLRQSGLTKGNLSSHLSRLEEGGLVEIEKTYRGKLPLTLCRLTPRGRESFEAYRRQLKVVLRELERAVGTESFREESGA